MGRLQEYVEHRGLLKEKEMTFIIYGFVCLKMKIYYKRNTLIYPKMNESFVNNYISVIFRQNVIQKALDMWQPTIVGKAVALTDVTGH